MVLGQRVVRPGSGLLRESTVDCRGLFLAGEGMLMAMCFSGNAFLVGEGGESWQYVSG